ncbi:MAG: hypothetical protein KGH63_04645, partial [Candidatus Micrarchaeota archaeon]|nr:hypothetical protein [Candidatus Micrarchaeota archaeon]
MADSTIHKLLIECGIALLVGLLAIGAVAHAGPTSLDADSYAQAARLLAGAPAGGSEMVARTLFSFLGPVLGWKNDAAGLIRFYLTAPLILLLLSAGFAYAALRLWRFGRIEAAGAALLVMLATPVAFAFYPGLWLPQTAAIPLTMLGLAGLAAAAREKDGEGSAGRALPGGFSFISLIVAVAGFGAAAYVLPWMAAVPLSILVGELALCHRDIGSLWRVPSKSVRLVALLLPVALAVYLAPPAFVLSIPGTMAFLYESRFALGFAAVAIPALLLLDQHPQAPLLAGAAIVGLLFGTASPAAAMVCFLLPVAYGIRTLGALGEQPAWFKATVFGVALLAAGAGLFSMQGEAIQIAGLSLMIAAGGVAVAFVYRWPSGLMRLGLLAFLLGGALVVAAQDLPGQGAGGPYHYSPLSPGVQQALQWIGNANPAGTQPRVAVIAPAAAVQL